MHDLAISLQALVAASVFFVWVVRYDNIVHEFQAYRLPDWLRDLVGILKLTFALMLLIGIERGQFAVIGGIGIALLMGGGICHAFAGEESGIQDIALPDLDVSFLGHRVDQLPAPRALKPRGPLRAALPSGG